ncbi:MAG: glycerate dehydrogenase [Proteobacteria bacterium]|nr:glycerate dehydrogenase [Pseudomonadota bacterium]
MAQGRDIVYPDADDQLAALLTGARRLRLEALGAFRIHHGRPGDPAAYLERLGDAAGVMLGWDLPVEVMRRAPRLEVVSYLGTGAANFVDLAEAVRLGITVCNTPGYGDNAVAEHALALLLALARRVPRLDQGLRQPERQRAEWGQSQPGFELRGRTLGLVGLGGIGARMAELARGLGMEVTAWTRNPSPERAQRHGVTFLSLDDLLATADVISLHLLLTPETEGLLGPEELDRMKPDAVLVNTARAELVDQGALVERLRDGRIAAAGLDVFWNEPLPADHPLLELDNVVLTPHVAFNTPEAIAAMMDIAIDNLARYFEGSPINVVAGPRREG